MGPWSPLSINNGYTGAGCEHLFWLEYGMRQAPDADFSEGVGSPITRITENSPAARTNLFCSGPFCRQVTIPMSCL